MMYYTYITILFLLFIVCGNIPLVCIREKIKRRLKIIFCIQLRKHRVGIVILLFSLLYYTSYKHIFYYMIRDYTP